MNCVVVEEPRAKKEARVTTDVLRVQVKAILPEGQDINAYEVADPAGRPLPPFEAGSHVDVHVPDKTFGVRQYSLCSDPGDCSRYVFTVQREPAGRGGSKAIHEMVSVGTVLTISHPRNRFPLHENARHHLLVAGGIGITPMIAMIRRLQRIGAEFTLHYCTRSPERTAFRKLLQPFIDSGKAFLYWDGGDASKGLDLKAALKDRDDGTHLYYCGPPGFMTAVAAASSHWPKDVVHREYFTPSENDPAIAMDSRADQATQDVPLDEEGALGREFEVKLASTGQVFEVPADKSIVQVLRENGVEVETACELGVCGTCRTRYLEGEVEHQDFVLEEYEQKNELMICCSRAKTPLLVLDR